MADETRTHLDSLSEEELLDIIREYLGPAVQHAALYVANLMLHAKERSQAAPAAYATPRSAAASPAGGAGFAAEPRGGGSSNAGGSTPATTAIPVTTRRATGVMANDQLAAQGIGSVFRAAASAVRSGNGPACFAGVGALGGGRSRSGDLSLAVLPLGPSVPRCAPAPLASMGRGGPRAATLLGLAMLMSDCGRGVPLLVRSLLEPEDRQSPAKLMQEDQPNTEHIDRTSGGHTSNGSGGAGGSNGDGGGGAGSAGPLRRVIDGFVETLRGWILRADSGLQLAQRQQLGPLLVSLVGELQAYDLYRNTRLNLSAPVEGGTPPGPPFALRGLRLTPEQRTVVEVVGAMAREPEGRRHPRVTRVQAFAGTAKTTTARAVVASLRDVRILYLVYNKAMQVEADEAMRQDYKAHGQEDAHNFTVMTTHALARRKLDYREHFGNRKNYDLSTSDVRRFLKDLWQPSRAKDIRACIVTAVRTALNRFMATVDEQPQQKHLSDKARKTIVEPMQKLLQARSRGAAAITAEAALDAVVDAVRQLWAHLVDPDPNNSMAVPHNAYLKLWVMQRPALDEWDLIIVDEAQDVNPITKKLLVDMQDDKHVLLLGDQHQQLYSFNYACGLMADPPRVIIPRLGPRLPLRQTFRFGPEITAAINVVMKAAFGEPEYMVGREDLQGAVYCLLPADRDLDNVTAEDLFPPPPATGLWGVAAGDAVAQRPRFHFAQCPLRGGSPLAAFPAELQLTSATNPEEAAAVLPASLAPSRGSGGPQVTVVARRNNTLVKLALRLVLTGGYKVYGSFQDAEQQRGGGKRALPRILQRMQDVYNFLVKGERSFPWSHVLHEVEDEAELRELVEGGADGDLANAYLLVKERLESHPGEDITSLTEELVSNLASSPAEADYHLVTAHKMKGCQHPVVQLAEDFVELSPTDDDGRNLLLRCQTSVAGVDELNAIYVAASRASRVLLLNRDLSRLVLRLHEQHVRLRAPTVNPAGAGATKAGAEAALRTPTRLLCAAFNGPLATPPSGTTALLERSSPTRSAGKAAPPLSTPPAAPATAAGAATDTAPGGASAAAAVVRAICDSPVRAPAADLIGGCGPAGLTWEPPPCAAKGGDGRAGAHAAGTPQLLAEPASPAGVGAPAAAAAAGSSPGSLPEGSKSGRRRKREESESDSSGSGALSNAERDVQPAARVERCEGEGDSQGARPRPGKMPRTLAAAAVGRTGGGGARGGDAANSVPAAAGGVPGGRGPDAEEEPAVASVAPAAAAVVRCPCCQAVVEPAAGGAGAAGGGGGGGGGEGGAGGGGGGGGRGAHAKQEAGPVVLWRQRPLCGACARKTMFAQVLELAAADRAQAAGRGGPDAG